MSSMIGVLRARIADAEAECARRAEELGISLEEYRRRQAEAREVRRRGRGHTWAVDDDVDDASMPAELQKSRSR